MLGSVHGRQALSPAAGIRGPSRSLVVAECFGDTLPTFQGEGPSAGTPALFIRLSRCNLACTWCDTRYTWDWEHYDPGRESVRMPVPDLVAWALRFAPQMVVITGGEPLLQQAVLVPLVGELLAGGKRIEIETNGTIIADPSLFARHVQFNVSPKLANSGMAETRRIIAPVIRGFAASGRAVFKFVARETADLAEIDVLAKRFGISPVYVMPEGRTAGQLLHVTQALAGEVAARGWHLTQRLHIFAFGDGRGR
jgi:7-carboxy-7-deazaguanine synthase